MEWNSAGGGSGTVHDVLRGGMGSAPGSGVEDCVVSWTSELGAVDGTAPAVMQGFWYLVRGSNACGVGSYGQASGGTERLSATCP
jgi:hypothetical protein